LEHVAKRRLLNKGQRLFSQGDRFRSLFVIRSGSMKAFLAHPNGDEQITGFHFAGDMLSPDGLEEGMHSYCVEALETTSVCQYPLEAFERAAQKIPALELRLLKTISRELSREKRCMMILGRMRAEQRLATFILDTAGQMARRGQSETDLLFSMTRTDIANYLGLAVETASRLLSRFAAAHLIRVHHRRLSVLDLAGLQQLAGGEHETAIIAQSA